MRPALTRFSVIAALAALGLLAGCGSGSGGSTAAKTSTQTPKAAFTTALQGLTDTDVLTITLKLETTPSVLIGFSKEDAKSKPLTQKQAQEIASAAFLIETKTSDGSKLSAVKPGSTSKTQVRFALQDNGQSLAEIRSLDNALYLQADLKSILDLFDKGSQYSTITQRVSAMPPFVKAFVQGKWVSLDLGQLKAMASQFGAAPASTSPQQGQKLLNDLRAALGRDVTVTRVGTDSQGDHLRISAQSRALLSDLLHTVTTNLPSASLATGAIKPTSVPDHSIVMDAWVSNGALSKLSLDVLQFASPGDPNGPKPGDHLPVVLQFDRSGDDISQPSGAVPVDTSQLLTLVGSLTQK